MQINVFIERENKKDKIELIENSSLKDLLNKLKITTPIITLIKTNLNPLGLWQLILCLLF